MVHIIVITEKVMCLLLTCFVRQLIGKLRRLIYQFWIDNL